MMNTPIVVRPIKRVIETIHMRSEVLKRDSKAIEEYLKQQQELYDIQYQVSTKTRKILV